MMITPVHKSSVVESCCHIVVCGTTCVGVRLKSVFDLDRDSIIRFQLLTADMSPLQSKQDQPTVQLSDEQVSISELFYSVSIIPQNKVTKLFIAYMACVLDSETGLMHPFIVFGCKFEKGEMYLSLVRLNLGKADFDVQLVHAMRDQTKSLLSSLQVHLTDGPALIVSPSTCVTTSNSVVAVIYRAKDNKSTNKWSTNEVVLQPGSVLLKSNHMTSHLILWYFDQKFSSTTTNDVMLTTALQWRWSLLGGPCLEYETLHIKELQQGLGGNFSTSSSPNCLELRSSIPTQCKAVLSPNNNNSQKVHPHVVLALESVQTFEGDAAIVDVFLLVGRCKRQLRQQKNFVEDITIFRCRNGIVLSSLCLGHIIHLSLSSCLPAFSLHDGVEDHCSILSLDLPGDRHLKQQPSLLFFKTTKFEIQSFQISDGSDTGDHINSGDGTSSKNKKKKKKKKKKRKKRQLQLTSTESEILSNVVLHSSDILCHGRHQLFLLQSLDSIITATIINTTAICYQWKWKLANAEDDTHGRSAAHRLTKGNSTVENKLSLHSTTQTMLEGSHLTKIKKSKKSRKRRRKHDTITATSNRGILSHPGVQNNDTIRSDKSNIHTNGSNLSLNLSSFSLTSILLAANALHTRLNVGYKHLQCLDDQISKKQYLIHDCVDMMTTSTSATESVPALSSLRNMALHDLSILIPSPSKNPGNSSSSSPSSALSSRSFPYVNTAHSASMPTVLKFCKHVKGNELMLEAIVCVPAQAVMSQNPETSSSRFRAIPKLHHVFPCPFMWITTSTIPPTCLSNCSSNCQVLNTTDSPNFTNEDPSMITDNNSGDSNITFIVRATAKISSQLRGNCTVCPHLFIARCRPDTGNSIIKLSQFSLPLQSCRNSASSTSSSFNHQNLVRGRSKPFKYSTIVICIWQREGLRHRTLSSMGASNIPLLTNTFTKAMTMGSNVHVHVKQIGAAAFCFIDAVTYGDLTHAISVLAAKEPNYLLISPLRHTVLRALDEAVDRLFDESIFTLRTLQAQKQNSNAGLLVMDKQIASNSAIMSLISAWQT